MLAIRYYDQFHRVQALMKKMIVNTHLHDLKDLTEEVGWCAHTQQTYTHAAHAAHTARTARTTPHSTDQTAHCPSMHA